MECADKISAETHSPMVQALEKPLNQLYKAVQAAWEYNKIEQNVYAMLLETSGRLDLAMAMVEAADTVGLKINGRVLDNVLVDALAKLKILGPYTESIKDYMDDAMNALISFRVIVHEKDFPQQKGVWWTDGERYLTKFQEAIDRDPATTISPPSLEPKLI